MTDERSHKQADVYQDDAMAYDALIAAEDADGTLRQTLDTLVDFTDKRVADVGAGTGRIARWVVNSARHVHLIDRAAPMLAVARGHIEAAGYGARATIHEADARALPLEDDSVDVAVAGWVFGHFRSWMPDGWRDEVDAAVAQMRRVVIGAAPVVIVETLGTGHEQPRTHPGLDEYFQHLQSAHGMKRQWVRTDYVFKDAQTAARVVRPFFGDALAQTVMQHDWARVPECTAIFSAL